MSSIFILISQVIQLYIYIVVGSVILSWLVSFNVLNTSNRFVYMVNDVLHKLTEPALRQIRRFIPSISGIDLSPVVLILLLIFLQNLVLNELANALL